MLWQNGAWMDPDMNKYDVEHVVADHPKMTRKEWGDIYRAAWDAYYSPEHLETILRRGAASGTGMSRLMAQLFLFSSCVTVEDVHPLQGGSVRLKHRRERRPGLPIEPIWSFYPRFSLGERCEEHAALRALVLARTVRRRIKREQTLAPYTDQALTPVGRMRRPRRWKCSRTTKAHAARSSINAKSRH